MGRTVITKRTITYEIGETISMGNYQSIKPVYGETIEVDIQEMTLAEEEKLKEDFVESVRREYTKRRNQVLQDFIAYGAYLKKLVIPAKG